MWCSHKEVAERPGSHPRRIPPEAGAPGAYWAMTISPIPPTAASSPAGTSRALARHLPPRGRAGRALDLAVRRLPWHVAPGPRGVPERCHALRVARAGPRARRRRLRARAELRPAPAGPPRAPRAQAGDHVQHLPGLGDLVDPVTRAPSHADDRGRRQRPEHPLPCRSVERLADEVLVGQRHQHRPARRDHLAEPPRRLQPVPGVLAEVVPGSIRIPSRRHAGGPAALGQPDGHPRMSAITSSYATRCGPVRGSAPTGVGAHQPRTARAATSASLGVDPAPGVVEQIGARRARPPRRPRAARCRR